MSARVSRSLKPLVLRWRDSVDAVYQAGPCFRSDQAWLEHSVGCAGYTVVYTGPSDRRWLAVWWHGNRGHYVGLPDGVFSYTTEGMAKAACEDHLNNMFKAIQSENDKLSDGGETK